MQFNQNSTSVPFIIKHGTSFSLAGGLSTFTAGNATAWALGSKAPSLRRGQDNTHDKGYVQVIFKNRSNEVIKVFQSLQENIQYCKLKYRRDGGLKEASFTVSYTGIIPYYGDMLIEFRSNQMGLGTIYSDQISIENGLLTITGYSAFSRLSSELKLTGESTNLTLKNTVLYFLNLIAESLKAYDNVLLFTINPRKIMVDDALVLKSCFFIEKSPVDILKGLATLGGKISYGIDEYGQFYFIDQTLINESRWFLDEHISDVDLKIDDGAVINQVKLFAKKQNGEQLALISTYRDANSIAQYGLKSTDVNLAFFIDALDPASYAKLFATPSPPVQGSFIIHQKLETLTQGMHAITSYLPYPKRLLFNACKDEESFSITSLTAEQVTTGFMTGRYAYEFKGNGVLTLHGCCTGCLALLVVIRNKQQVSLAWSERGRQVYYHIEALDRIRVVKIDTLAIDDGLTFKVNGTFLLDSVAYITDFVETSKGYYEAHELELVGNNSKITLHMGNDKNTFIEQAKELKDNAALLDSLLKQ